MNSRAWRKSSHSNPDGGNCVEVLDHIPTVVPVRDSKAPERGHLTVADTSWTALTTALKRSPRPNVGAPPVY